MGILATVEGIEHHTSGDSSLTLDARHFPLLIATWRNTMSPELAHEGTSWVTRMAERARAEDVAFILVSDTTRLTTKPRLEVGNGIAACIDHINERDPGRFLRLLVVVRSRMMRAFIAMVLWMLERKFRISTASTIASALETARSLLENTGISPPESLDPSTYRLPSEYETTLEDAGGL